MRAGGDWASPDGFFAARTYSLGDRHAAAKQLMDGVPVERESSARVADGCLAWVAARGPAVGRFRSGRLHPSLARRLLTKRE